MSKFKEYLKTMDKRKKYIGISAIGLVACVAIGLGTYSFFSSKPVSNNKEPERELIVQEQSEKVNKYTGDKKDFHFNKYWSDRSGGIYTINESNDVTNVEYKKNMGSEWAYMATPVEGNFSDFKYINLKVSGDKGKKLFLKLEENLVELKAKFFTLNGKEQILTLDISDVKNKKKLDALKEVMLFASPGEVQDGSFKIIDAWFSMESATVNKYTGDKKDFHFNKYWEDIFNHGIAIEEENETTTMTFTKPKDNNWVLASTAVEGKLSDFNYATLKVKGEVGQKFLLKLEKGDSVYGEKLVELSGEEEVVIVKLNKDDMEGLDSLKEVRVFPNAGEPESGKLDILDAWFSVEKPEGFKEAGEATPSGASSEFINGWKIEEWTKYVGENVGGLTKVTYNNPEPWAYVTYNVEGKISGNNLLNIYLNSNGCDHVMIKLRGKFKYVDPVGGYNVYDEVEVFSDKIKQGETNLQVDITDAVKELGHVVEVVMFVESSQNVKDVDRVGSLIFGVPKFTEGQASGNATSSSKWIVDDWTGYTAEIKDGFTRISYDNPAPWANISYNIKNLLKDNDFLELKLNSNGADHIQVKLRGKYLNSDPGYKVYQEALVFDGKLNNGEKTLKLDLKEAINELGRENITDIMLFIESNQLVNGLDRKGSLDIYTPVFKKATQTTPETPGTPEEPGVGTNNEWVVDEWTGYTAEVKDGFTRISYDNPAEWAYINLNIKNLLKDNDVLSLKLNSNGADHVQIKLRGKYLNSDPGYKVYDDILIFDGKLKNGEQTLNLKLKDFIKELGRENITDIIMFVESSQTVDGLDRKGSLDIYTPVFNKDTGNTPETPVDPGIPQEPVVSGKWEVGEWTGYKAEIKDGFTRIKYDKVEPWASITYNIKDMLKDNTTLNLKLNSDGADSVLIKIRGKFDYVHKDGYDVYEEEEVFNEKINSGERTLKLDLKEAIEKLGRENITDIVMFIESNDIEGLDKKGSLDIYTPIFNKEVVTNPTPEKPVDPGTPQEPSEVIKGIKKYELEITADQLAEIGGKITDVIVFVESDGTIKDLDRKGEIEILETALLNEKGDKQLIGGWSESPGSNHYSISNDGSKTIVKYNDVGEWATIWGKATDDKGYNDKISIIFNTNGCDHLLVKIKGTNGELELGKDYVKNMPSSEAPVDPSTPPESSEVIKGIKKYELSIPAAELDKIGGKITDVILFVESDTTIEGLDRKGEIEILETALLNEKGDKQLIGGWSQKEDSNHYSISNDGSKTIVKYNDVGEWATIWGKVTDDKGYNDKISIIFNTNGCDHLLVKIKGTNGELELGKDYVKNMPSSEAPVDPSTPPESSEVIKGIKKYELSIPAAELDKIGGKITDVILFVESDTTIEGLDRKGEIEILETALLNEKGDKQLIGGWSQKEDSNHYSISNDGSKTIVKYNDVGEWATIWGKATDDKGYNDKISIIFNTNGCDHLLVKIKGTNGELELGKDYVKNMPSSEAPVDPSTPPESSEVIKGIKKYELSIPAAELDKIGGKITDVILFVESDTTIEGLDRKGEIEILETALLNEKGDKQLIGGWSQKEDSNHYSISNDGSKTIVKYNDVGEWATIWGKATDDKGYNDKISIIFNTNGCDHLLVKIKGTNGELELGKDYVKNMPSSEAP